MIRSQSGGVRFKNIIIIIEKDKAHYPETKMQGTGIKMYTVRTTLDLTHKRGKGWESWNVPMLYYRQ